MADREPDQEPRPGVELVLEHLNETRAFDFTGYKRATVSRRIEKRMEQVGVATHADYVDYLEVHPEEFTPLFNTILINVTSFFRDPDAWEALREQIEPQLAQKDPSAPFRVWSAGCSSGQEAYTAVMLLAEVLGEDAVRDRVKVYATDVDEEALEQARRAVYADRDLESLPPELADRYFEVAPGGRTLRSDLRRAVIFGRHDLLQDAPISRVDLLLCRNTLMYFNADAQAHLVNRLHYSLADSGILLLGKVEMLLGRTDLFESLDVRQRLFRKIPSRTIRGRLLTMADHLAAPPGSSDRIVGAAFENQRHPEIVLDQDDVVVAANSRARTMLGLLPETLGRPFQDLEISYRPVELRSWIQEARRERRMVQLSEVARWTPSGELTFLDVSIVPLDIDDDLQAIAISFIDVSQHRQLQEELEQTHRELEVAYEELQSANEELETTNEELQSTIEELETTNEELQSTNEELETMNEELSSTNEELHAINEELRERTGQIDEVNAYLESVLTSLDASVIVLDTDQRVRVWNGHSFAMWGLRSDEVEGRPFLGLDIGFPVESLRVVLAECIAGTTSASAVDVDATNRRGVGIRCHARVAPLTGTAGAIEGAIVIIEQQEG